MFAKPNWFRTKTCGRGVAPATWCGWLYLAGVVSVALLPAVLLLGRRQGLEALIWLGVVAAFVAYDMWHVRRVLLGHCVARPATPPAQTTSPTSAVPPAADDGIYFLEQRSSSQPVNTTRFQLSLKQ